MTKNEFTEYYPEIEGYTQEEKDFIQHEVESGASLDDATDLVNKISNDSC